MVSFTGQFETPRAAVREKARFSPQTTNDTRQNLSSSPNPRNESRHRGARVSIDLEPYSSAVLRPLTAACVFRDCSLRIRISNPERRACRALMRQAAIKWRCGLAMGDL